MVDVDLLIPADPAEVSDIDSPEAAQNTPGPSKTKKTKQTKKDEDIQDVDNRSVRTTSVTPEQGGNGEDLEEVEQRPEDEVEIIKKRKGSPPESSSRKKSKAPVTKMKTTLTPDDFSFLLATMNEAIEEITEKKKLSKRPCTIESRSNSKEYNKLSNLAVVSSAPLPEGTTEEGNEPVQLHQIANTVEVHLQKAQEETTQATQALKQAQEEIIEQRRAAQQEKDTLQAKFEEDRAKIQKEKEKLLAKQIGIEEAVNKAFLSVTGLEQKAEDPIECQVMTLAEVIQQLQQRVMDLELQTIPQTPQEVHDQREITAQSTVERIKALSEECKQLSSRSAQIYENLAENPELHKLESQLQEVKYEAERLQVQLKALSPVERMKRFPEQRTTQQWIHMLQSKVMEVSQRLQPVQEKACQLFTEVESQGIELEQVVNTVEQCLEGPVNEALIQEFIEQEVVATRQVEAARAKLEEFKAELVRPE
jgi:hypothetical protein